MALVELPPGYRPIPYWNAAVRSRGERSLALARNQTREAVFGLSADNPTSALPFADIGLRGFLNRSDFIFQHDEAILQIVVCRVRDLANVAPVITIQLSEGDVVKGLIRAEQAAEARARTGIDAGVGAGGYGKLRQANPTKRVAKRIASNDPRLDFNLRRAGRLDVVRHPADQPLSGRVRHEVQRYSAERGQSTVG